MLLIASNREPCMHISVGNIFYYTQDLFHYIVLPAHCLLTRMVMSVEHVRLNDVRHFDATSELLRPNNAVLKSSMWWSSHRRFSCLVKHTESVFDSSFSVECFTDACCFWKASLLAGDKITSKPAKDNLLEKFMALLLF